MMVRRRNREADLRLYYVTDKPLSAVRGVVETALLAVRGGATIVQLRDPDAKAGELVETARALVAALRPLGIPVIVNNRPDVALAAEVDGVHVGQGDLPPAAARAILGEDAIVGLSVTDASQMSAVPWSVIDHLGVGPVVSKGVKPDAAEPMGFAGLAACAALSRKPLVAIGGMTLDSAASAIAAGADGLAVVAAIAGAEEPRQAAAALRKAIDEALSRRARGRR
jgi:thiamine-phosphate pyrophosphorylase